MNEQWEIWQGESTAWNALCLALEGYTIFQRFEWALYKQQSNWEAVRCVFRNHNGKITCALQLLIKRTLWQKFAFCWCPGGPMGDVSALDENFLACLKKALGLHSCYLRISFQRPHNASEVITIRRLGWQEPRHKLLSGLTFTHSPLNVNQFLSHCSSNWRHNYKRGLKKNLRIERWEDPDALALAAIYQSMQAYKGIEQQYSLAELKSLLTHLPEQLIICRAVDANGQTIAIRGAGHFGNKAWDLLAASSPEARKCYASYLLYVKLLELCAQLGIDDYDLGGIDPAESEGVFNFKKGTGALARQYLGEWELASSSLTRGLCNQIVGLKTRKHI